MSFYQHWQQLDWEQLLAQVGNATAEQVEAALARPKKEPWRISPPSSRRPPSPICRR